MAKLKCMTKSNTKHSGFGTMKLYRLSEVRSISFGKFGDEAGLEKEKQRRELARLERNILAERKRARKAAEARDRERGILKTYVPKEKDHVHTFGPAESASSSSPSSLSIERCTECGFEREFEEF
eukprot:TRINITY_DN62398_c0_g1_i2.p3 TRINITY_DN62398_c0_g1~~TRINITY_DN62398_c0_g1_i2.p3  ORF type:complete len:125 (+),score=61.19 TRINITY_DN62398_c0_g1_i2:174-548(+)